MRGGGRQYVDHIGAGLDERLERVEHGDAVLLSELLGAGAVEVTDPDDLDVLEGLYRLDVHRGDVARSHEPDTELRATHPNLDLSGDHTAQRSTVEQCYEAMAAERSSRLVGPVAEHRIDLDEPRVDLARLERPEREVDGGPQRVGDGKEQGGEDAGGAERSTEQR